jgi:phage terminase small subunit
MECVNVSEGRKTHRKRDVGVSISVLRDSIDGEDDAEIVKFNLNPQMERFAQELARGKSQRQAAIDAGYSPTSASVQGARLFAKAKVKQRVAQLQMSKLYDVEAARADHIGQLVELRELAKGKGQISAAIKAEELRGRVLGLYVEQSVRETVVSNKTVEQANEDELRAAIRNAMTQLGLVEPSITIDATVTRQDDDDLSD